jgi:ABC-type bacteriocin/lantibiotic exporter with double-glycine peptidase domain
VTFAECDRLPISSAGTSLLALRDAAKRLHINAEIRRYRAEDIAHVPLPAVGQFSDTLVSYHFHVIYRVDADRVYVLDGTTGQAPFDPAVTAS